MINECFKNLHINQLNLQSVSNPLHYFVYIVNR